jgi:hypothetical protein
VNLYHPMDDIICNVAKWDSILSYVIIQVKGIKSYMKLMRNLIKFVIDRCMNLYV